jgi:hypothetical protein
MIPTAEQTQRREEVRLGREAAYRAIEALHEVAYSSLTPDITLCQEFFHAVNELLSGTNPEELELHKIDRAEFLLALRR